MATTIIIVSTLTLLAPQLSTQLIQNKTIDPLITSPSIPHPVAHRAPLTHLLLLPRRRQRIQRTFTRHAPSWKQYNHDHLLPSQTTIVSHNHKVNYNITRETRRLAKSLQQQQRPFIPRPGMNLNKVNHFQEYVPVDYGNLPHHNNNPKKQRGVPQRRSDTRGSPNNNTITPLKRILNNFHERVSRILLGRRRIQNYPRNLNQQKRVDDTTTHYIPQGDSTRYGLNTLTQQTYVPILQKQERIRKLTPAESKQLDRSSRRRDRRRRRNRFPFSKKHKRYYPRHNRHSHHHRRPGPPPRHHYHDDDDDEFEFSFKDKVPFHHHDHHDEDEHDYPRHNSPLTFDSEEFKSYKGLKSFRPWKSYPFGRFVNKSPAHHHHENVETKNPYPIHKDLDELTFKYKKRPSWGDEHEHNYRPHHRKRPHYRPQRKPFKQRKPGFRQSNWVDHDDTTTHAHDYEESEISSSPPIQFLNHEGTVAHHPHPGFLSGGGAHGFSSPPQFHTSSFPMYHNQEFFGGGEERSPASAASLLPTNPQNPTSSSSTTGPSGSLRGLFTGMNSIANQQIQAFPVSGFDFPRAFTSHSQSFNPFNNDNAVVYTQQQSSMNNNNLMDHHDNPFPNSFLTHPLDIQAQVIDPFEFQSHHAHHDHSTDAFSPNPPVTRGSSAISEFPPPAPYHGQLPDHSPTFTPVSSSSEASKPTTPPASSREQFFKFSHASNDKDRKKFQVTLQKSISTEISLPPFSSEKINGEFIPPVPPKPIGSIFELGVPSREDYNKRKAHRRKNFENLVVSKENKVVASESSREVYSTLPDNWNEFRPDPSHTNLPRLTYEELGDKRRSFKTLALTPKGIMKAIIGRFPRAKLVKSKSNEFLNHARTKFTHFDVVSSEVVGGVKGKRKSSGGLGGKRRRKGSAPKSIQDIIDSDSSNVKVSNSLPEEEDEDDVEVGRDILAGGNVVEVVRRGLGGDGEIEGVSSRESTTASFYDESVFSKRSLEEVQEKVGGGGMVEQEEHVHVASSEDVRGSSLESRKNNVLDEKVSSSGNGYSIEIPVGAAAEISVGR